MTDPPSSREQRRWIKNGQKQKALGAKHIQYRSAQTDFR